MADSLWGSVIEAIGIGGSLIYYGVTCQQQANAQKEQAEAERQQAKAQETQNLIAFDKRHREFWREAYRNPELKLVFEAKPDVQPDSLSIIQEEFINEAFVFYEVSWRIVEQSYPDYLHTLARDMGRFLSLPLPAAVWKKTREARDKPFVHFAESAAAMR
jgi:hypothetical protein